MAANVLQESYAGRNLLICTPHPHVLALGLQPLALTFSVHDLPTAGDGALLGAGVSVLGPIRVGAGCKVGAGSVVVKELPDYCVAVGVPARIIKQLQVKREPSIDMDQCDDFILDYVI
jgi:serine acetyltransferase